MPNPHLSAATAFLLALFLASCTRPPNTPGAPVSQAENDLRIDYIELTVTDVAAAKAFYQEAFGWTFTDYGPDYTSFEDGRLAGGLRKAEDGPRGGTLVVIYAADLEAAERRVRDAGGELAVDIHSFPGGRRFHFRDPSGNELAVWSDR